MHCPRCGSEVSAHARFCGVCGGTIAEAPVAQAAPPLARGHDASRERTSSRTEEEDEEPRRKKGRGCCCSGCMLLLILLALLLLLIGAGAAVVYKVPERIGLVQSPAAKVFAGTPDRLAALAVKQELAKAGIPTAGMEVYILPFAGQDTGVLYALMDSGQGFVFKRSTSKDVLIDYMSLLGGTEAARQAGVTRVAMEYRGKNGQTLVSLTATAEAISGFVKGTMPRDQFLQKLEGDANWPAFYQETLEVFQ